VLTATIEMALASGTAKPPSLERVTVDTTVREKVIAHPTDSRPYLEVLQTLVRRAKKAGLWLRQSHARLARKVPDAGPDGMPAPSSKSGCAGS